MKSIVGVWNEYWHGTQTRPAVRRLINDHGNDWQNKKYGYDRKVWAKKRRLIAAIEGLKNALGVTSNNAIKLLDDHMQRQVIGLHTFCIETKRGLPPFPKNA